MTSAGSPSEETTLTERLRLVSIGVGHAGELYRVHGDDAIAAWYWGRWTVLQAQSEAARMARSWAVDGIGKWLAYRRDTGELIGRGGLSRVVLEGAPRVEVGWAVRGAHWGQGYATEIGRAGLRVARDRLGADEVVAFTEPHNARSRAVMERLGMRYDRDIRWRGDPFVLYRSGVL